MTYLFWAFVAVWVAMFAYLRVLARKSRALAEEIESLRARTGNTSASLPAGGRPVTRT